MASPSTANSTGYEPTVGRRPTEDETRALYIAEREYEKAKPWQVMPNDRPLVIHNTLRRHAGYLAIHQDGAAYYHGRTGLRAYLNAKLNIAGFHDCLSICYRQPDFINAEERTMLENLNLQLNNNQTWPIFRSWIPYHTEWPPNAPQTQLLTEVLHQTAAAADHIRNNPQPTASQDPERPALAPIWTVTYDGQNSLSWMQLPSHAMTNPAYPILENERLNEATNLPRTDETWDMAQVTTPYPLFDEAYQAARPHYPVVTITVTDNNPPKHFSMLDLERHTVARLQSVFLQTANHLGRLPKRINILHPNAIDAITPLAAELSIELIQQTDMTFDYEDVRPFDEQIRQAGDEFPDEFDYDQPAPAPEPDRNNLNQLMLALEEMPPLAKTNNFAALMPGALHHPNRPVSPPKNLTKTKDLQPGMTIQEALYTMAVINVGHVNLSIAAKLIIAAGVNQQDDESTVDENIRHIVADDDRWKMVSQEVAYCQQATLEDGTRPYAGQHTTEDAEPVPPSPDEQE